MRSVLVNNAVDTFDVLLCKNVHGFGKQVLNIWVDGWVDGGTFRCMGGWAGERGGRAVHGAIYDVSIG